MLVLGPKTEFSFYQIHPVLSVSLGQQWPVDPGHGHHGPPGDGGHLAKHPPATGGAGEVLPGRQSSWSVLASSNHDCDDD